MDENLFESVQYAAWVFLFIFALSAGIYQYSRMNATIDQFVAVNMFNDRGTGTSVFLDSSEIEREASRAEVIMSILNLPDTVAQVNNPDYSIYVRSGSKEYQFTSLNSSTGENGFWAIDNSLGGTWAKPYILQGFSATNTSQPSASDFVSDFKTVYVSGSDENTTFEVDYLADKILYTRN